MLSNFNRKTAINLKFLKNVQLVFFLIIFASKAVKLIKDFF